MEINIDLIKRKISNLTATNRNEIYDSHLYWSQKPYNVCDVIIQNFSKEGDCIFDPFMGSGVSLIQSITKENRRRAIGCEINDVPIFILDTLLKKHDIKAIELNILEFYGSIQFLNKNYETKCPNCGGIGTIKNIVFDREGIKSDKEIKVINYKCNCAKGNLHKEPDNEDYNKMVTKREIKNIDDVELICNTRIAVYQGQKISDIFTERNFSIIDDIIGLISKAPLEVQYILKYILVSILHLCKITDTHSNSQWPLWTPKKDCVEKNIIDLINNKINSIIKALSFAEESLIESREKVTTFKDLKVGDYLVLQKGCQNITTNDIPNNSIDLVITDPPYLGQVLYSEYMQLYKPFLDFNFNLDDEIVVSTAASRNKKESDYFQMLESAFEKVSTKMKEGSYLCMYFHDSNLDVWHKLIEILKKNKLRYISQVHIKKKNTLKNIISPKKSLNGDAILFFVKETNLVIKENSEVESIDEIEINIIKHAKYVIKKYGALTTPQLYDDGIMEFLIHNGWLKKLSKKYKSLVEIFEKYLVWDSKLSKWTI